MGRQESRTCAAVAVVAAGLALEGHILYALAGKANGLHALVVCVVVGARLAVLQDLGRVANAVDACGGPHTRVGGRDQTQALPLGVAKVGTRLLIAVVALRSNVSVFVRAVASKTHLEGEEGGQRSWRAARRAVKQVARENARHKRLSNVRPRADTACLRGRSARRKGRYRDTAHQRTGKEG